MSRFIKISADGAQLPAEATDHVAVLDTTTGLQWSRGNVTKKAVPWKKAETAAGELELAGADGWRLPTVEELFGLADRSRFNPAIDTEYFDCVSDWYWTSTPWAGSPASAAWSVDFLNGSAHYYGHDYTGFVRAVRRASPAGQ